jgi:hypothetical protein
MKLRIKGDSIRMRLTRSEVEVLRSEGIVSDSVNFKRAGVAFGYEICSRDAGPLTSAFDGSVLRVLIPRHSVLRWAESEEVSMRSPEDEIPSILVEKDFACLTLRPHEDESDMFPNPSNEMCGVGEGI